MNTYYLRMEGVNLSNFVYDTQDLSTIRGGGLLLLDAVKRVESWMNEFADKESVKPISTGASSGLFQFSAADGESIRKRIERELNTDVQLRHATFVVDVIGAEDGEDFFILVEKLVAMNRWRQMQSPSLAIPTKSPDCKFPCSTDLVRPQSADAKHFGKDGARISDSVFQRREYGKNQKQAFYQQETGLSDLPPFVKDLGALSSDRSQGNLHNKLAVIYLDGNAFGRLQRDCGTAEELYNFDLDIKTKRRAFLAELLQKKVCSEDGWKIYDPETNQEQLRFELLLWGGDEMILVVPAWKGWETLQFFYQEAKEWVYGKTPLRHGGGIVFCHHKAHIHRVTALAKELAEMAKHDRSRSLFAHKSLESFDDIGHEVKGYFDRSAREMGEGFGFQSFVLEGLSMPDIASSISNLKNDEFPRGKIYKYLKELHSGSGDSANETITKTIKQSSSSADVNNLQDLLNGGAMQWMHVAELWDYIPVERRRHEQGGAK